MVIWSSRCLICGVGDDDDEGVTDNNATHEGNYMHKKFWLENLNGTTLET
jgi:hypothetical protein